MTTIFLVSCASTIKSKKVTASEKKGVVESAQQSPKASQEKLVLHFDNLIKHAKKEGAESIQYLATDLYIKAMDSSLNGDPYSAAFLLKYSIKLVPNDLYIQKKYGIELIKTGKIDEALSIAKKIVKSSSYEDESYALILAGIYTALNKTSEARLTYKSMIKVHPKSVEACTFLGKSYIETKEYKKALKHFGHCEKRIKKNGLFSYYKGRINNLQGKEKKAIKLFRKSLRISPEMEESILAIGEIYEKKDIKSADKKAISIYKKFLIENPESFDTLTRIVELMFKNELYSDVIGYAELLTQLDPSNLNLKVRLGIVYTDFKKYELAKEAFKDILHALPDSDKVLYYLASLYQQTGEMELSVEYFSKIKTDSSLYQDSSLQIAQILRYMAQNNEVRYSKRFITYAEKKLKELPELRVDITVFLVSHLDEIGQVDNAIKKMEDIVEDKKFTDDHSYLLASLFEKVELYGKSDRIIHKILSSNPEDASALNFLGYSLLERGKDLEKAYKFLSKALRLEPNDGYINDSLGWYFYKIGKYKKAKKQLERAYQLVKSDPIISKHLAQVYSKLKSYEEAENFYKISLKLSPSVEETIAITKELENLEERRLPASKK